MQVRSFLGMVRYLSAFLPNLAEHTAVLTRLTTKDAEKNFPSWDDVHEQAFRDIKKIIVSRDCLTTIDFSKMPANKIYVTTDTSDTCWGTVLSFGLTWETVCPVAVDSYTFKGVEPNYLSTRKNFWLLSAPSRNGAATCWAPPSSYLLTTRPWRILRNRRTCHDIRHGGWNFYRSMTLRLSTSMAKTIQLWTPSLDFLDLLILTLIKLSLWLPIPFHITRMMMKTSVAPQQLPSSWLQSLPTGRQLHLRHVFFRTQSQQRSGYPLTVNC